MRKKYTKHDSFLITLNPESGAEVKCALKNTVWTPMMQAQNWYSFLLLPRGAKIAHVS